MKEKPRWILGLFTGFFLIVFGFGGTFLGLGAAKILIGNPQEFSVMDIIGTSVLFFGGLVFGITLSVQLITELESYFKQLIKTELNQGRKK